MKRKLAAAVIAALVLGFGGATAQNFKLNPTFGEVSLTAGFTPDPYSIEIVAGGSIHAPDTVGCAGYVAEAPDFRLSYEPGAFPLIISVLSVGDTTLVIRDPSSNWICDDDSGGGLNPLVNISVPQSGNYDIWVGDFGGDSPAATLTISEVAGIVPDPTLPPTFGEVSLNSGFAPTPYSVAIVAGGAIHASFLSSDCGGSISEASDFRLNYQSDGVPLVIAATSDSDTTLVVRGPAGDWICDDDSGGSLNPLVSVSNALSGQYDIWVGTYGGGTADATLNISEVGGGPAVKGPPPAAAPTPPPAAGPAIELDPGLPPLHGEVAFNAGFEGSGPNVRLLSACRDGCPTALIELTAGGDGVAAGLHEGCTGFVTSAPAVRLNYSAGSLPLYIYAWSDDEATLIVHDPQGNWTCDDNMGEALIAIDEPVSGQYDIWVGNHAGGDPVPATLYFSSTTLDEGLTVRTGEYAFAAGATIAGYQGEVEAGGLIPARGVHESCSGYVNSAPTYSYTYTPGAFSVIIEVEADVDTTLVVRDPEGNWHCDGDSDGNGNLAYIMTPAAGRYDIWIGTIAPTEPTAAGGLADDPIGIGDLVDWFIGDPTGIVATLIFWEL